MSIPATCPLCDSDGGTLIWSGAKLRVIRAQEAGFPGFYRVVWTAHVAEFSDLSAADRSLCMEAVTVVERVLREQLSPTKINLAALGNMVAHLHWHVIARYDWDSHFPAPIWAGAQRGRDEQRESELVQRLPQVDAALVAALNTWAA
ncbi:HIT family protein [Comamonas aquatilis]|uniref:HIT family protein n=1 Tax=Comamonas aquatilis TaxID=1778406 RepID=UPI0039F08059